MTGNSDASGSGVRGVRACVKPVVSIDDWGRAAQTIEAFPPSKSCNPSDRHAVVPSSSHREYVMPSVATLIVASGRAPCCHAAGLLAGVVPLLVATASPMHAQSERRTVRGAQVAIYNVAGRMTIERGTGSDVEVEVVRGGRDGNRLRIKSGTMRGRATLRVLYPADDIVYPSDSRGSRWGGSTDLRVRDDGTWGGDHTWHEGRRLRVKSRGSGIEAWADIRIKVPDGRDLAAYLAVGDLTATDVEADLVLDVASSRVLATGTRGRLTVDAGSGGVTLRDVRANGLAVDNGSGGVTMTGVRSDRCAIDTGSGGITGDELACRTLQVSVGSGGVRMDRVTSDEVQVETGSGSVRLDLATSPRSITVESGSGGVTMVLPARFGGTVDVETGSGGISSDFPVTTNGVARNRLRGTVGSGDGQVRIETGSGGVRLLKGLSR